MPSIQGKWELAQSNNARVTFDLNQTGNSVTGSAASAGITGTVTGTCNGTSIILDVAWSNGSRGEYIGNIAGNGRACGLSFVVDSPDNQASWFSIYPF
jgi:hypothetical protein